MEQSPSMRRILTEMRKKRERELQDARAHLEEIRQAVGLDPEESFDGMDGDDNLLLAAKAMQEKQRHDAQCAKCPYSVETCEQCRYNGSDFQSSRFSNPYLRCVKPCGKYRARMEQKRIAKLMGESGMGVRFQMRTFATFHEDAATETAKRLAQAFCAELRANPRVTGIMMIGPYGCGKTHLAAAILHQSAEDGIPGMFVVVPELLTRIREGYRAGDDRADSIIDAAKNTPLLVLDDLGAEKASAWVHAHQPPLRAYAPDCHHHQQRRAGARAGTRPPDAFPARRDDGAHQDQRWGLPDEARREGRAGIAGRLR